MPLDRRLLNLATCYLLTGIVLEVFLWHGHLLNPLTWIKAIFWLPGLLLSAAALVSKIALMIVLVIGVIGVVALTQQGKNRTR